MANLLLHLSSSRTPLFAPSSSNPVRSRSPRKLSDSDSVAVVFGRQRRPARFGGFKLHAVAESDGSNWWEKNVGPNMIDAHSTEEFISILSQAGDTLVIIEFYGTWCASCRALFPKLCRTAQEHPDILFVKVDFDANKPMCKRLNVRVLPYFHFYRGADGQLESFSCSFAKDKKPVDHTSTLPKRLKKAPILYKFQKIKDAIAKHNTPRCSIGPPVGVGDVNLVDGPFPKSNNPAKASSR